jgi:hypothetical protein
LHHPSELRELRKLSVESARLITTQSQAPLIGMGTTKSAISAAWSERPRFFASDQQRGGPSVAQLKPRKTLEHQIPVSGRYDMSTPRKYSISVSRTLPEELRSGIAQSNSVTVAGVP